MARKPIARRAQAPSKPALAFQDDTALQGPQQAALLDQMKAAGARDLRINVLWNKVRRGDGYDFSAIEQEVNAARARGLRVQMTLMGAPTYSPDGDQSLNAAHNDPRLWQRFASDVAGHFKGRVGRYSIGNELQFDTFLAAGKRAGLADTKAAGRAARPIYRAGYAGVKAADRSAQVMLPELSSSPNAKTWLSSFLAGKPIKTAGLAYHPYDQPNPNAQNTWDIDTLQSLQRALAGYKRRGKLQTAAGKAAPLYLTEMGYQATDAPSERERAARMARAYRLAGEARARQFLSYQIRPTPPKMTAAGAPTVDAYGGVTPGAPGQAQPGWVWNTSVSPTALRQAIRAPIARKKR